MEVKNHINNTRPPNRGGRWIEVSNTAVYWQINRDFGKWPLNWTRLQATCLVGPSSFFPLFSPLVIFHWFKVAQNSFRQNFDVLLQHSLSVDARIRVSKQCPIIGERVVIVFVTLYVTIVTTTTTFIMTRIFTILQKYIHIKLKKLDNSNSANPQVAWANLGGPHLYLY